METKTDRENAGPSPFSRPPQPKPTAAFGGGPAAIDTARQSTPAGAAGASPSADERRTLEAQRRGGGQWFYWIAGLSLINAVLALTGQDWHFILGLGVTQLVQGLSQQAGAAGIKAGLVGLAVIGLFAVLGQRAILGHRWAFVLGMALFGLDGVIFLVVQDWVGVGFHAFALVMILRGYLAARRLPAP
ncbi:MAG TPA: hypothetical protein VLG10_09890 [Methylomirabilota bacterium]|nr:hypothetical protein [Methylomirabilota bacterium]